MHLREYGLCYIAGLILVSIVSGAYTEYQTTDYLGPTQLPTVYDAFDLNTAASTLKDEVTDFGLSSILNSGDDWVKETEKIKKRNVELQKELALMSDSGDQYRKRMEILKNQQLINKVNKLAIIKYSDDNKNGANNREISDRHLAIAANLEEMYPENMRKNYPEYNQMRLAALEAASEADMYNTKAWDARIQMLEELGRHEEAEQVKDERNARIGESALSRLLPLSPFAALASIVLTSLSFVVFSRKKRKNPVL